jgi:glucose-1-phosphate cytidylyltransferase
MKAVILAGGLGLRISEETISKPKPMVKIGEYPILWHILKIYSTHGINDFIICCGYKGYVIKEYFANYFLHQSDVTFSLKENKMRVNHQRAEPWNITLVDTGLNTMTGGRLIRLKEYLINEDDFCLTYGDGVGDIDITKLIAFHRNHGKLATLTASYSPARFGILKIERNKVLSFEEKPEGDGVIINAGFFVLKPDVFDYINEGDKTVWEQYPLKKLSSDGNLMAFQHRGFWQPMDTLRDNKHLNDLWNNNKAPWKKW